MTYCVENTPHEKLGGNTLHEYLSRNISVGDIGQKIHGKKT